MIDLDSFGDRRIEEVQVFHLKIPLTLPYTTSLGVRDHFETFLVRVCVDGVEGVGESVPAPGYSHETARLVERYLEDCARRLPEMSVGEALSSLSPVQRSHPFAAVAIATAIEVAIQHPKLEEDTEVPLVGTLMTHKMEKLEEEIEKLLQKGYSSLKVKVGWDEKEDAAYVRRIQYLVQDSATIRLDANQGYTLDQARYFVSHIDSHNVEHFEQPFSANEWDAMSRLSKVSPLPLMLDESINSEEALEKLIESECAQAVKFKLMKAGGCKRLIDLILRSREAGLKVILGNGVSCDIGAFHELAVAAQHVETAGEMNGFLKLRESLLSNNYSFAEGSVRLPQGYIPEVDWERIGAYAVGVTTTS